MKRLLIPLTLTFAATVALSSPAVAAQSGGFTTSPVSAADTNTVPAGIPQLLQVSTGHHATFDRVVFRFSGPIPGYTVEYVNQVVQDGSGKPIALEGTAFIRVVMNTVASGQVGAPLAPQGDQKPHFAQLREVVGAGDFEGYVSFGLGLASKSGFRVSTLTGPDRLVVDVAIPADPAPSSSSSSLPATGFPVIPAALVGLLLVLIGVTIYRLARPRAAVN